MNEEVKLKVSIPMFEEGELERFDSNMHSVVEEYSKLMFKEKDQILTQRIIMKQEEEIERLQNIIKEVREYIEKAELREDEEGDTIYLKDDLCGAELLEILDKENNNE